MSTTFGQLGVGAIVPQTGFAPRQDPNGGWVASRDYAMSRETFIAQNGTFVRGSAITSVDDTVESFWSFLKIESGQVLYEEGGNVLLRITYTGSAAGQYSGEELSADSLPQYNLVGSLTAVSLSEHPKFIALSDLERSTLGKIMLGQAERIYDFDTALFYIGYPRQHGTLGTSLPLDEQLVSGDSISFAKLIAEGETTYLRPTFTWTETTQGNIALTSSQINKLGRIATPRGNPPTPSGTRDWMLTNATQDQRGELYQTRLEWTLSERGGHNSFLYDT